MNHKTSIILIIVLMWSTNALATYNTSQVNHLHNARMVGKYINNLPETAQAIILQESSAGAAKWGDDDKSLGLGHVTVGATIDVLRACKKAKYKRECGLMPAYVFQIDLNDSDMIRTRLLFDDGFNLFVSAMYFKLQLDYFVDKGYSAPWSRAVIAYNRGRHAAKNMSVNDIHNNGYLTHIKKRIKNIRKFNKTHHFWK